MRRINVVGTTGSGKTHFSDRLAALLGVPHIELDAIHWGPEWTAAEPDVFRARVADELTADGWVVDGQYSQVLRPLVWSRADTVVWLDYSFPVMFRRLFTRTFRRVRTGEPMWNDNRESLRNVFSRDSIFWWQLKTFRRKRRTYPEAFMDPEFAHLEVIVMKTPGEAEAWLDWVARTGGA